MNGMLHARLRDARYALPGLVERIAPGGAARDAAARCARLGRRGVATTVGYFGTADTTCETVARANAELAAEIAREGCDTLLALKAPAMAFDSGRVRAIAAMGVPLVFDALAEPHAARTLRVAEELGAGIALPARWRRSAADAGRLRDKPCRIRLVKGEWSDPAGDVSDVAGRFLELASSLAGRGATVAVATHDPALAEAALGLLQAAGTPCELEQLRGLPRRRTMAVARRLGVAVRLYQPFGPGWWSYAVDKALGRPYLPVWALKDWLRL